MRHKRQLLAALIGPVGSGKTYIAKRLAKKLRPSENEEIALFCHSRPRSRSGVNSSRNPVNSASFQYAGFPIESGMTVFGRSATNDIRVRLRREGRSYASASRIARAQHVAALAQGKSVIADFDAILPRRQQQLKRLARRCGVKFFLIEVRTPEDVVLKRLRAKRYTAQDLFPKAKEAIRVYFIRRALHERHSGAKPHIVINNAEPLAPQLQKAIKEIRKGP